MKCLWCLKDKEIFCLHHVFIPKKENGKGTVSICTNCHSKIHRRLIIGLGYTKTPRKTKRHLWRMTYAIWQANFPGLPYWIWMWEQDRLYGNPLWMGYHKKNYPTPDQFYGSIREEIQRRLLENIPHYAKEHAWIAEVLEKNNIKVDR